MNAYLNKKPLRKTKKWLWIVLTLVALLVAVAVALAVFLQPAAPDNKDPVDEVSTSEVYWNLDRLKFTENSETNLSTREPGEDGLYHFRFASQGKLMELATADQSFCRKQCK